MKHGPTATPIFIGQGRSLTVQDLGTLQQGGRVVTTIKALRNSHHNIARLAAAGLNPGQIAERTGYTRERVGQLLYAPAMIELVALYRAKVDEAFVNNADAYFELATRNMVAAERQLSDRLDAADAEGETLPVRELIAISRDAADRFGYGKRQTTTNINVDFAAALERAISRSGKQLESVAGSPHNPHRPVTDPVTLSPPRIRRLA